MNWLNELVYKYGEWIGWIIVIAFVAIIITLWILVKKYALVNAIACLLIAIGGVLLYYLGNYENNWDAAVVPAIAMGIISFFTAVRLPDYSVTDFGEGFYGIFEQWPAGARFGYAIGVFVVSLLICAAWIGFAGILLGISALIRLLIIIFVIADAI